MVNGNKERDKKERERRRREKEARADENKEEPKFGETNNLQVVTPTPGPNPFNNPVDPFSGKADPQEAIKQGTGRSIPNSVITDPNTGETFIGANRDVTQELAARRGVPVEQVIGGPPQAGPTTEQKRLAFQEQVGELRAEEEPAPLTEQQQQEQTQGIIDEKVSALVTQSFPGLNVAIPTKGDAILGGLISLGALAPAAASAISAKLAFGTAATSAGVTATSGGSLGGLAASFKTAGFLGVVGGVFKLTGGVLNYNRGNITSRRAAITDVSEQLEAIVGLAKANPSLAPQQFVILEEMKENILLRREEIRAMARFNIKYRIDDESIADDSEMEKMLNKINRRLEEVSNIAVFGSTTPPINQ